MLRSSLATGFAACLLLIGASSAEAAFTYTGVGGFTAGDTAPDPSWCGNATLAPAPGCGTYLGKTSGNDTIGNVKSFLTSNGLGSLADSLTLEAKSDAGTIDFDVRIVRDDSNAVFGAWDSEINPGTRMSIITVKGANEFSVYRYQPAVFAGFWSTEELLAGNGNIPGLSHFSAFVPLPAALPLLLSAILGLFGVRLYRNRAQSSPQQA